MKKMQDIRGTQSARLIVDKAKKVTITKVSTKAKTLKGLKKKKKYFVRIRAYKKSGSKKIYGKWKKISKKTK